jgi:hypothetical protein
MNKESKKCRCKKSLAVKGKAILIGTICEYYEFGDFVRLYRGAQYDISNETFKSNFEII